MRRESDIINAGEDPVSVLRTRSNTVAARAKCRAGRERKPATVSLALDTDLEGPSEDYGNEEHTTVAAFLPWRGS